MAIRRIGQILVDMGFVSDDQLEMLLEEQQNRPGTLLGKIAIELNLVTEEQLVQALSEQMGMRVIDLGDISRSTKSLSRWLSCTAWCRFTSKETA
jgi:type IV pilus assembly protein PilB